MPTLTRASASAIPASRPSRAVRVLALGALVLVAAACGSGQAQTPSPSAAASTSASPSAPTTDLPVGGPVTDDTKLCDLLGPGDFEVAGIAGAGLPEMATDGPGSAYCVYAGESGGTGGIELDVFIDEDPDAVYETMRSEGAENLAAIQVPGADRVEAWAGVEGDVASFARIVARSGNLVFAISAPGGPGMDARLATLAALVVARGAALAG